MGEAKRRRDQGLPPRSMTIAAAWHSYRRNCIRADATAIEVDRLRIAFFAGASVLFYGMLKMMDPGEEPTDADLKRMDHLNAEIEAFSLTFDQAVWADMGVQVGHA